MVRVAMSYGNSCDAVFNELRMGGALSFRQRKRARYPADAIAQSPTTSPNNVTSASKNRLDQIRSWSSHLTAEERNPLLTIVHYYWPKSIARLHGELKSSERKLVAVIGVQGVGKTSAMYALQVRHMAPQIADALDERFSRHEGPAESKTDREKKYDVVVAVNWGDMRHFLSAGSPLSDWARVFFGSAYCEALNAILRLKPAKLLFGTSLGLEDCELYLGRQRVREARWNAVNAVFKAASNILIDMPDYSKTDRRLVVNDLETIQALWRRLCGTFSCKANLVIFIQKEMFRDHYLFGKMDVVELERFRPEELVESYKEIHGGLFPFSDESLLLVAQLSRGIYRRFLKYIYLILENQIDEMHTITKEDVRKNVTDEQLFSDREQELAEIFPKSSQSRLYALKVMQFLETRGAVNQKELAKAVGVEEYALSRILDRLEFHHEIRRERRGLENMVLTQNATNH